MRLKICDTHLTCKVANRYLNVPERVEVAEWNKRWNDGPSLSLLSCASSVSVKENSDKKKGTVLSKKYLEEYFRSVVKMGPKPRKTFVTVK